MSTQARDGLQPHQGPAARLRAMFAHIDAGDWEALAGGLHPDMVYERPGYPPFVGRRRVLDFYRRERVVASGRHEIEGIIVDDDTAACWGRMRGVLKDGSRADVRFAEICSFAGARLRTRRSYFFQAAV